MTKAIKFKSLTIGGGSEVSIQSMLNCDTLDSDKVKKQIDALSLEGCDIIRLAVEDERAVEVCREYLAYSPLLLVADIQFDYRLAIKCCEIGFEKIRFNPGNIGGEERLNQVIDAAKMHGTAVRIGVNSGSVEKDFKAEFDSLRASLTPSKNARDLQQNALKTAKMRAELLAASTLNAMEKLLSRGLDRIVLSVKSSDPLTTVLSNRILAKSCDCPLHIGVTESGRGQSGETKSAVGIGSLLLDGIGDTIRVSLTGDPTEEVRAAKRILRAAGLGKGGCEIVSCPTCSRCKIDLEPIVKEAEEATKLITKPVKIAIMGCAVNGPGEAADADFGLAFGGGKAVVFKAGSILKTVEATQAITELKSYIHSLE